MIVCGSVSATGFRQPVQGDVLMGKSAIRMRTDAYRTRIAVVAVSAGSPVIRNKGCVFLILSVDKRVPIGSDAFRRKRVKRTVVSRTASL